jgi:hypothetical protein
MSGCFEKLCGEYSWRRIEADEIIPNAQAANVVIEFIVMLLNVDPLVLPGMMAAVG